MMQMRNSFIHTTDPIIRVALKRELKEQYTDNNHKTKIIDELGLTHGTTRIDIAVVNGILHGYELKSDMDTLARLPFQIKLYNTVLDKITLVVGKNHLFSAIKIVPDWWGIIVAKVLKLDGEIIFHKIREPEDNPERDSVSIARLLWREEALELLEEINQAKGVRSKPRQLIYERLAQVLAQDTLREKVRQTLFNRTNWRSEILHKPNDD